MRVETVLNSAQIVPKRNGSWFIIGIECHRHDIDGLLGVGFLFAVIFRSMNSAYLQVLYLYVTKLMDRSNAARSSRRRVCSNVDPHAMPPPTRSIEIRASVGYSDLIIESLHWACKWCIPPYGPECAPMRDGRSWPIPALRLTRRYVKGGASAIEGGARLTPSAAGCTRAHRCIAGTGTGSTRGARQSGLGRQRSGGRWQRRALSAVATGASWARAEGP